MTGYSLNNTDVLVLGGGISGLIASIKARNAGAERVTVIDKSKAGKSGCSAFGAGVFRSYLKGEDDFDVTRRELVMVNHDMIDQEWNDLLMERTHDLVVEMDEWGVEWEKTADGKYKRTMIRSGAPDRPLKALMFHGPQLMAALRMEALKRGVVIKDRVMVTDLISDGKRVSGAVGFNVRTGEIEVFRARATVLSTGGTAYKSAFLGHKTQTGDAQAMLYRAGGTLMNFDLCGQHVSCALFDTAGMSMFVAEGGRFVNSKDEAFLHIYDPVFKDRTQLFMVAGAMAMETMAGFGPIYLDMTHFRPEQVDRLGRVVPLPSMILTRAGLIKDNRITKKIEWVPTNFGTIGTGGGAQIDLACRTTLQGLFAAGDASSKIAISPAQTGPLPWAAVSGAVAGEEAARYASGATEPGWVEDQLREFEKTILEPLSRKDGVTPSHVFLLIEEAVAPYDAAVIKSETSLKKTLDALIEIEVSQVPFLFAYDPHYLMLVHEARSMVLNAEMWVRSCLVRKESRGTLMKIDYPYIDNDNWLKWVLLKKEGGEMKLWTEDIPVDRYRVKPLPGKRLHPVFEGAKRRGIKWEYAG